MANDKVSNQTSNPAVEVATTGGSGAVTARPLAVERASFVELLLGNPNYFGNIEQSLWQPVKPMVSNISFEQLMCVGLQPDFDRLEAVIEVKQDTGYGGGLCAPGSREFVRFYADYANSGQWTDLGMASVAVHDIPGPKPLCYAVVLDFAPLQAKLCSEEDIIKVRAILSWQQPPAPGNPNFTPVYGNRLEVSVQLRPASALPLPVFVNLAQGGAKAVKAAAAAPSHLNLFDSAAHVATLRPQPLTLAQKQALYAATDVPPHRYAFTEAKALLAAPLPPAPPPGSSQTPVLAAQGLKAELIPSLLGQLSQVTNGDTGYEELICLGLRPERDLLEGVLTVKRSSGYSGGLCTAGSTEYVAFWMDFGTGWTYMGTGTVAVHDLTSIPAGGLQYSVFLPTDLSSHLAPCAGGARTARVRAILSWAVPPPPGNPNAIPVWGNRVECTVQLRPQIKPGRVPLIETVGDMGINDIGAATGLANGYGVITSFYALDSPFGGSISITGVIDDPPDTLVNHEAKLRYRIEVRRQGASWQPLTNTVTVKVSEFINGAWVVRPCTLFGPPEVQCDVDLVPSDDHDGQGDGWYDYLVQYDNALRVVADDLLGRWPTTPEMEGLWQVRLAFKDTANSAQPPVYSDPVLVCIDNTAPTASADITSGGGDCGTFKKGASISGVFQVADAGTLAPFDPASQHFGSFSFAVLPADVAHGAAVALTPPTPAATAYPALSTQGGAGTWSLDTSGMDPCGYVIRLTAYDRTNYNSGGGPLGVTHDIGFCLVK